MKSKRVLTILLSMAIMLTFMPTLAFAGTVTPDAGGHDWDEGTVVKEANCATGEYGVVDQKCTIDNCEATHSTLVDPEHSYSEADVPVDEIVAAAIANTNWKTVLQDGDKLPEVIESIYADYINDHCRGVVDVCDNCGDINVVVTTSRSYDYQAHAWIYEYKIRNNDQQKTRINWLAEHSDPPFACSTEKYVCEFCGQEVIPENPEEHVADPSKAIVKTGVCGSDEDSTVTFNTCKVCGEKMTPPVYHNFEATAHSGLGTGITAADFDKLPAAEKALYIQYDEEYYKYNTVIKEPTCIAEGTGKLVCTVCGEALPGEVVIPMTDHHLETLVAPATCKDPKTTTTFCTYCGKAETETEGQALGHKYEKVEYAEPTCFDEGLTLMECTVCGAYEEVPYEDDGHFVTNPVDEKKFFFTGVDGELLDPESTTPYARCISVDIPVQPKHDLGEFETMTEATCEEAEVLARKCSECGFFIVHDGIGRATTRTVGEPLGHEEVEIEIPATCGTWGEVIVSCTRCGKEISREKVEKPVVAVGTPCNYVWEIVEEPTPTKDGLKQYKCTECGDVAFEESISYDGSKEEQDAKDAAIENAVSAKKAADAKLAAGNLTDDSAKAIADAKADLETAMTSGGSADLIAAKTEVLEKAVANAKAKAANTMTATANKIKASKKKTKSFSAAKAFAVSGNAGAVSYAKVSGNKKISVAADGTVKVKKGLKKGKTYKVTVNVTDAGNGTTLGATVPVVLKVKIKK